jgi:membrane peptidoglycan carboxypeptidase
VQLGEWFSKIGALGRLIVLAVVAGVLVAAVALPLAATTGITVRNAANSFTTLSLNASSLPQRSEILDREGNLITYVYGVDLGPGMTYTGINRQPVTYSQISPNMLKAIVAIEDDRFWQRGALDIKGTLRAVVNDVQGKAIQGASTIEQQYVKNVLVLQGLGSQTAYENATADTASRKIAQLREAVQVAHSMSKQDILASYLNDAYFGEQAYGVEAAAETYFHTTAAKLTLPQAATLAGIVEDPSRYDPVINPQQSKERRDTVLARMEQTGTLSAADEAKAIKSKLTIHNGTVESGCGASTVGNDAFFCDYVEHTILLDKTFGATAADRARLLATGGLKIYTTLDPQDQNATAEAVNYVMPASSSTYNPAGNVDTEVLVQPGTGDIMGMDEDRSYGTGPGQTEVNYAVNSQYGGQAGVQTGSSSKLFTLVTALNDGMPFGYTDTVQHSMTVGGFTNCAGDSVPSWQVVNADPGDQGTYSLYTGTADSINTFYARLEQKVGLCNVVKTAVNMGLTTASGENLLQAQADSDPAFTLGAINVSPLSMAAAYATAASGGMYCAPVALTKVIDSANKSLPVPSAGCHRAISSNVAAAVNYILQGVFTWNGATGAGLGPVRGYQTAGKTGTSNVANNNGTPYAAFAGYTTNLVSYTSVFNPNDPTTSDTMANQSACYRSWTGGLSCPSEMFGANAPGSTFRATFDAANLGPWKAFGTVPHSSQLWSKGNGQIGNAPAKQNGKNGNHGKGGGNTGGTSTGGAGTTGGTGGTSGGGAGGGGIIGGKGGKGGKNGFPVSIPPISPG